MPNARVLIRSCIVESRGLRMRVLNMLCAPVDAYIFIVVPWSPSLLLYLLLSVSGAAVFKRQSKSASLPRIVTPPRPPFSFSFLFSSLINPPHLSRVCLLLLSSASGSYPRRHARPPTNQRKCPWALVRRSIRVRREIRVPGQGDSLVPRTGSRGTRGGCLCRLDMSLFGDRRKRLVIMDIEPSGARNESWRRRCPRGYGGRRRRRPKAGGFSGRYRHL